MEGRPSRPAWLPGTLRVARTALLLCAAALGGALLALLLVRTPAPTLTIQVAVPAPPTLPPPTPTEVIPTPEPSPVPATPTAVRIPTDSISLRLVKLEQDLSYANGNILILQAAARLQAARIALNTNQPLSEVNRQLVVAQQELDSAIALAPEGVKGALQALNSEINYLRDDLAVRPETVEARLGVLWEQAITLVDVTP